MLLLNSTTALNPLAGSLRYKYIGRLQSPSYPWEPRYTQLPQRHQRRAAAHPGYSSTQGPGCGPAQTQRSATAHQEATNPPPTAPLPALQAPGRDHESNAAPQERMEADSAHSSHSPALRGSAILTFRGGKEIYIRAPAA